MHYAIVSKVNEPHQGRSRVQTSLPDITTFLKWNNRAILKINPTYAVIQKGGECNYRHRSTHIITQAERKGCACYLANSLGRRSILPSAELVVRGPHYPVFAIRFWDLIRSGVFNQECWQKVEQKGLRDGQRRSKKAGAESWNGDTDQNWLVLPKHVLKRGAEHCWGYLAWNLCWLTTLKISRLIITQMFWISQLHSSSHVGNKKEVNSYFPFRIKHATWLLREPCVSKNHSRDFWSIEMTCPTV